VPWIAQTTGFGDADESVGVIVIKRFAFAMTE
jgi:hypothetical protein